LELIRVFRLPSLIISVLLVLIIATPVFGTSHNIDHIEGQTVRIVDNEDKLVTMTARKVFEGDEIITAAGQNYRIISVKGDTARAELVGQDEDYLAWTNYFNDLDLVAVTAADWGNRPVGVYHTHTDESYVPSDGKSSIPYKGGIYQVGNEFVKSLQDNRVDVKYYETPHDPHDENAYARSRRTAMGLLKNNPIALFDIHRDGVPNSDFFKREVSGEEIAQLRIVVGRQNPKMESNMDFARRLMAYANKKHPGLVKEIYKARGNYNQDLLSTAILLEAGTFTNVKQVAENGARFLAEAVPVVLGVDNPGQGITSKEASGTGWKVAFWLTLVTLSAGIMFVLLNFGWKGTVERAKELGQRLQNSELWLQLGRAGSRGKEFAQGPLLDSVRSMTGKIKGKLKNKNKV